MSKNHFRLMIACLVLSVFEDCSDAFISKRREFAQVKGSPSTESVNFWRSHYNPYPSSAEQTTRPEQSTPDAAHTSTEENHRNGRIPAYLLKDFQPRAQRAEMTPWPPNEQGASHSIPNLQTSFVKGSPQNVKGLYSFTGTRQMKALGERSRLNDVIHKSYESGVRPPASRWARPSQYGGSLKENPSITSTDQLVHGYQFKTRTIDESVVQPVSGATRTHQRVRSGLEVYPNLSIGDDASKSIPNNFSPSTQHSPVMDTHGLYRHMQPAPDRLSLTNSDNSQSVNNPTSSSNMNPQSGPHYKMHRSSHINGAPSSQEEFPSQPSHPKVPGVLNRGFDSKFQPVAGRYSFGASDVVPSPSPSPGRDPAPRGPLPDRFAMHPWDGHTRGIGPERSFLTTFRRDKMAATHNPGRSTNVKPLYRFQGSNHQPHRSRLVSTVGDVQLSRGAIDESSHKKSIQENQHFGNTIYEYPSVFKKYGFGTNRATNPTPVRSHSIKMEGLNEHSRNNDATIHKSNEYDVKPLAHLEAMPFQYSSYPKEIPSIASIDQSVNIKHPFVESGAQLVYSAPQRLGFIVHPPVSTGDDTSKSVPNKFPPTASLGKTDPVVTHENTHNPRQFESQKREGGVTAPSPVSFASRQWEGTVAYLTDPTSIPYRENVSEGLGKTQTLHNSDKPGSLPIWQPINHTQLSIMPESFTASPVLDQSTTDPRSKDEMYSQREAALGIYRLRGKKLNTTVGRGPKFTPKNISSTQNSLELPASETRTDPNAQPVSTATDLGTRRGTPTNALPAPWGPQPGPEAGVANFVSPTPENPSPVQEKPVPQTAATKIVPTLYDILYRKPTSSLVRGNLVKGKLPMTQNHNGSFTFIKTHFPPIVGLNKHINSKPIQFADVAGSASFSSIKPEKRPQIGDPLTRIHSTTDAKATANQEGRAQIPAPIRRDLSSRGSFFSMGGRSPRSVSRVSRQEGRVDAGSDGCVLRPG